MLHVIQHLFMLPLLVSIVLGLKNLSLPWSNPYKTFSILLISIGIVESLSNLWSFVLYKIPGWPYSNSSYWIMNIGLILIYFMYIAFYYKVLNSPTMKKALVVLGAVFIIFTITNWFLFQSLFSVNSYAFILACGIVIFMAAGYFEQSLKEKNNIRPSANPLIWISSGALLFHTVSIPYISLLSFTIKINPSLASTLFFIHTFLNFSMYLFYVIALLCQPLQPK